MDKYDYAITSPSPITVHQTFLLPLWNKTEINIISSVPLSPLYYFSFLLSISPQFDRLTRSQVGQISLDFF